MPRKLKTYQTSLGFYDLAIAAPSMKAALEAWGAGSNLFHQGVAKESGDPEIVAATMSKPGVVLRRPVGSYGPFREHADLPTDLAGDEPKPKPKKTLAKPRDQAPRTTDDTAARKGALAFEREQRQRENQRRKEKAARERDRQRRNQAIARVQAALEKSEGEHHKRVATIQAARDALEKKSQVEDARWAKEKDGLERALRRARE
jgi:colicin import membrane protein